MTPAVTAPDRALRHLRGVSRRRGSVLQLPSGRPSKILPRLAFVVLGPLLHLLDTLALRAVHDKRPAHPRWIQIELRGCSLVLLFERLLLAWCENGLYGRCTGFVFLRLYGLFKFLGNVGRRRRPWFTHNTGGAPIRRGNRRTCQRHLWRWSRGHGLFHTPVAGSPRIGEQGFRHQWW